MTLILSNIKVYELLLFFPQALLASNYGYMITISNNEEKIYTQISNMKIWKLDILELLFTCTGGLDPQGPVDHELGFRPGGQDRGETSEEGFEGDLNGEEGG